MLKFRIKYLLGLGLFFSLFINCSKEREDKLKTNTTISAIFDESEIKDLQIIFDFFNNQICSSDEENYSLNICYKKYCSNLLENLKNDNRYNLEIDFENQLKLYEKLNTKIFNDIWVFGNSINLKSKDTTKSLGLNHTGKYSKFLNEYAKENTAIKEYYDVFKASGDLSPSMTASVAKDFESYKIADIRTKLIFAIHHLTLNDNLHRK